MGAGRGVDVCVSARLHFAGIARVKSRLWRALAIPQKHTHTQQFLTEKLRWNTIWFYCLFPFLVQAIFPFGGVNMFGPYCCPSLLDFIPGKHWHRQELVLWLQLCDWWKQLGPETPPPSSGKWFTSKWEKFVQTYITNDLMLWRTVCEVSRHSSCNRAEL